MILMLSAVKILVFQLLRFPLATEIGWSVVFVAILLGVLVPVLSNIGPIRAAVATSLRDSLDIFGRRAGKIDEVTVQMTKIQDMTGISPTQTIVGLTFTVLGFVIYYFFPMAILLQNMDLFFFLAISFLFIIIVGMIFISQMFIPALQNGLLSLLMLFRPSDR